MAILSRTYSGTLEELQDSVGARTPQLGMSKMEVGRMGMKQVGMN
jgi:hypothetical protein